MLVDGRGDAWLVGFGGGYTNQWDDEEFAKTRAGDLQGLAKLVDYIGTGEHTELSSQHVQLQRLIFTRRLLNALFDTFSGLCSDG